MHRTGDASTKASKTNRRVIYTVVLMFIIHYYKKNYHKIIKYIVLTYRCLIY